MGPRGNRLQHTSPHWIVCAPREKSQFSRRVTSGSVRRARRVGTIDATAAVTVKTTITRTSTDTSHGCT